MCLCVPVDSRPTNSSLIVCFSAVFDDGDEKTLRRSSLCLKGARHFAESEASIVLSCSFMLPSSLRFLSKVHFSEFFVVVFFYVVTNNLTSTHSAEIERLLMKGPIMVLRSSAVKYFQETSSGQQQCCQINCVLCNYVAQGKSPPFVTDEIPRGEFLPGLKDKSFALQFIVWKGGTVALICCLSPLQTLDRLPLTNPEHFGTPVIGKKGNRGRRSNPMWVLSSVPLHPAGLISGLIYQRSVMLVRRDFCTNPQLSPTAPPPILSMLTKWKIYSHLSSLINSPWGLEEESPLAFSSSLITPGSCACMHACWRGSVSMVWSRWISRLFFSPSSFDSNVPVGVLCSDVPPPGRL